MRLDHGPVRLRRNGRQRRAVGLYFSVRNGRHLPHESTLELHDLWRAEVESEVVASWPQPFTLQLVVDGERWRYTPDQRDLLADGSERIVEVKPNGWANADPAYAERMRAVGEVLAAQDLEFEVRDTSVVEAEPSFSAVAKIQSLRRTAVFVDDVARVQDRLAVGAQALAGLQETLGGGPRAFAVLCAMAVRRMLRIDHAAGLHPGSPVSLVP